MRSLIGFGLIAAALGAVVYSAVAVIEIRAGRDAGPRRAAGVERVFAVDIGTIRNETAHPRIEAFGEIRSWRSLELRATGGGYIVELSEKFRDGEAVEEGDVLFALDSKDAEAIVGDAEAALEETVADLAEARQSVAVAEQELRAAETQRDLRDSALDRRQGLKSRGVATAAEVEEAEMASAAADQTVASRAQMLLAAQLKIERAVLAVRRAEIAVANARRDVADTVQRAPFDGLLSDVTAVLGGLATSNERLGVLIDPTSLEAVFRVTNAQFARLIDENGVLRRSKVLVTLDLDDVPMTTAGEIDRSGAVIGSGETGRLVYARIDLDEASIFRPGDFVTVAIDEPPLENVAEIPAAAVTEAGEMLVVGPDERLRALQVRILRRQGDAALVAGAPDGARYVRERAPQLGAGIKVRPIGGETPSGGMSLSDAATNPALPGADADLVDLDPERQRRLIGYIESADEMPADMKVRLLGALRSGRAPAGMLEQIEARMGESG